MTFRSNRTLPISAFIIFGTFAFGLDRPASPHATLIDIRFNQSANMPGLIFEMKNTSDHAVRPLITWSIRDVEYYEVASGRNFEAGDLHAGKTMNRFIPVGLLPSGRYQVFAEVDFQDNDPIQTMLRMIDVRPEYFP